MRKAFQKIRRVEPLIDVKRQRMNEEAATLVKIREEKVEIVKSMKESQKQYMKGIEELNQVRASKSRANLTTLEESLDFVKSKWYRLYKQVQEIEQKEKAQLGQLMSAERDLKSIEKLKEKYQTEFQHEIKKADQKTMDESALRRFIDQGN